MRSVNLAGAVPALCLVVAVFLATPASAPLAAGQAQSQTLAFRNVTVIDGTGAAAQPGMTVLVTGNRITAVGRNVQVPQQAQVIDGTGKFLIPGLWDMHIHLRGETSVPLQRFRLYSQVLLAAHGVTGVRIMSWLPAFREIRRELAAGTLAGPRVVTSSRAIDGLNPRLTLPPPYGDAAAEAEEWRLVNLGNRPRPFQVGTPAEAREVIALATKAGVEVAKIHSGLTPELYFALADAAKTAGLYLAGHAPTGISIATLSDTGMRSIEHFQGMLEGCSAREDEILKDQLAAESLPAPERNRINAELRRMAVESFSAEKCRTLAVRLVKNGTWLSPTFTPEEGGRRAAAARSAEFARFVPAPLRARWEKTWAQASAAPEADPPSLQEQELARLVEERSREIVTIMRRAGVQFVIGTDAGGAFATPGPTLHEGLEETVKFGLTPMEAIEAATSSSARLLRMDEELGTIQTGKLADLVLLDANPLDQIANTRRINAVVMNGRLFDRRALDELLAQLAAAGTN